MKIKELYNRIRYWIADRIYWLNTKITTTTQDIMMFGAEQQLKKFEKEQKKEEEKIKKLADEPTETS